MPEAKFDFRIRSLPPTINAGALRCVLLPHLQENGQDSPWAVAVGQQPDDPGAPQGADRSALWLPPAGTTLEFLASNPLRQMASKIHRFSLKNDDAGLLEPVFGVGPADPRLVCFEGLGPLGEEKDGIDSVASARHAKEFLLNLIEAFRFDGTLEDYASLDNTKMLACLSHLVFEIHTEVDAERGLLADATKWDTAKVRVTYPSASAGETPNVPDGAEAKLTLPLPPLGMPAPVNGPSLVAVGAVQRADGVYFKLLKPKEPVGGVPLDDECKLILYRSEGNVPLDDPPAVVTSFFGFQKLELDEKSRTDVPEAQQEKKTITQRTFHIINQFGAGAFVGRQLHYRLDIVDGFGIVRATSACTLLRQRFDPPPLPGKSQASLTVALDPAASGTATLTVEAEYAPGGLLDLPLPAEGADDDLRRWRQALADEYEVEVRFQERTLDECGFYGDDDDFALLEGLKQADALYDPKAANDTRSPIPGHPLEDHLRGLYDHAGLEIAPVVPGQFTWTAFRPKPRPSDSPNTKPPEFALLRIEWSLALDDLKWLRPLRSYQFYVGLRRKRPGEVNVRALLSPCKHRLCFTRENGVISIDVFQLEFFRFDTVSTEGLQQRFLHQDFFQPALLHRVDAPQEPGGRGFVTATDHKYLAPADAPVAVELVFTHPAAGHPDSHGATVAADGSVSEDAPALPVGGVRILVRDRVAAGETTPFRVADTLQVLPRTVALYRPIAMEDGLNLTALPANLGETSSLGSPATLADSGLDEADELIRCFGPRGVLDGLRRTLRETVRAVGEKTGFRERSFDPAAWAAEASPTEESIAGAFDAPQAEIDALIAQRDAVSGPLIDPEKVVRRAEINAEIAAKQLVLTKTVVERARSWLDKARQALEIDLSAIKRQPRPDPAPPAGWQYATEFALTWWPALGRLVGLMRQLGLAQDLVVKLGQIDDVQAEVQKALDTLAPGASVKIITVQTADGDQMATVRLVVMPWAARPAAAGVSARPGLLASILGENSPALLTLYENCARGPRLLRYRDATRAPLNLSLRRGRLVRYRWHGLQDRWHHELEFCVQLLDRYERIRERYLLEQTRSRTGPKPTDDEVRDAADHRERRFQTLGQELTLTPKAHAQAVREITVPRLEPLGGPPRVFPSVLRDPWLVAFEILDTEERQKAAHNALTHLRSGNLLLHAEPSPPDFLGASAYLAPPDAPGQGAIAYLQQLAADAQSPLFQWWCERLGGAGKILADERGYTLPSDAAAPVAERLEGQTFLRWRTEELNTPRQVLPATRTAPSRPACDVLAFPDKPHYLRYGLDCFYSADHLTTTVSHAQTEREPWQLTLPFTPQYDIYENAGILEIFLSPALLGSHFTERETEHALGVPTWDVAGAEQPLGSLFSRYAPAPPAVADRDWNLPLALLPDVWVEYTFYLNVSDQAANKLVPFFSWKAPRVDGQLGVLNDAADKPMGFDAPAILAPALLQSATAAWLLKDGMPPAAVVRFTALFTPGNEALLALLAGMRTGRVYLTLRRLTLNTGMLPLVPPRIFFPPSPL